jgi:hypothetical protein
MQKTVPSPYATVAIPMSCTSHSRERMSFAGLVCIFVLALCAGGAVLRAQDTVLPDSPYPSAPIPASVPTPAPVHTFTLTPVPTTTNAAPAENLSHSNPSLKHDSSGSDHGRGAPRNNSQGFSLWDRTPLDAAQHSGGARGSRSSALGGKSGSSRIGLASWGAESGSVRTDLIPWGGEPVDLESLFRGTSASSFGHGRGSAPGDLRLNQLTRGDLRMYLKSSAGSFRLSYQDAYRARSNGLGGGVGQGSAGASFYSPTFGNGIFNLSTTSMRGSGSPAVSSRGGFSGSMSGSGHGGPSNPGGTEKHPAASVSLHLHF